MMFDYLWGEIALVGFILWTALLLVAIGVGLGEIHARMDKGRDKDVLCGPDITRNGDDGRIRTERSDSQAD